MKEASSPQTTSHGGSHRSSRRPDSNSVPVTDHSATHSNGGPPSPSLVGGLGIPGDAKGGLASADPDSSSSPRALNTPQAAQPGAVVGAGGEKQDAKKQKKPVMQRFMHTFKQILFCSKINVLLVFVPVGIAVAQVHSLSPGIIFAMNAIAIVPLAGLLSFATESVAHRLGDSLGALLNVTFGNAVELIIL
jgi:Ca2+:H+ antiporter